VAYWLNIGAYPDHHNCASQPEQYELPGFPLPSAAYVFLAVSPISPLKPLIIACVLSSSVLAVYFTESINEYAAQNWSSFSKQQYFDSNGLFISTVFSIPILLNCMLLIVSENPCSLGSTLVIFVLFSFQGTWLYSSTQLMVTLKTAQMKERIRKERQNKADTAAAAQHGKAE